MGFLGDTVHYFGSNDGPCYVPSSGLILVIKFFLTKKKKKRAKPTLIRQYMNDLN